MLFPLFNSPENIALKGVVSQSSKASKVSHKGSRNLDDIMLSARRRGVDHFQHQYDSDNKCSAKDEKQCTTSGTPIALQYPYVLSLHGTGISPRNQADAYKTMPKRSTEYIFGIESIWVITPSRHGAHNWEAIGELSGHWSVLALQSYLRNFPELPQLDSEFGVFAGHSMGGHGSWIASVNRPDSTVCISATAGWIRKEEYGHSNAFFHLDLDNTHVDAELKSILEKAMGEFHVDKMVSNLQNMNVHIRVGGIDMTTHPWYSRRMHRLLIGEDINSTYEEVHGKQHWWWDTNVSNDGGVLNDEVLRNFYSQCLTKSDSHWMSKYTKDRNHINTTIATESALTGKVGKQISEPQGLGFPSELKEDVKQFEAQYIDSAIPKPPKRSDKKVSSDVISPQSSKSSINHSPRCKKNFMLTVFNPAMQQGLCGLRVMLQHDSLSLSSVAVNCTNTKDQEHGSSSITVCELTTRNVERFEIRRCYDRSVDNSLFDAHRFIVNGILLKALEGDDSSHRYFQSAHHKSIGDLGNEQSFEVCVNASEAKLCPELQSILWQKSLMTNVRKLCHFFAQSAQCDDRR